MQERIKKNREKQLISQIEKERQAEYPEEAEQLKIDTENYDKINKMQSSDLYKSLPLSLKKKLITAKDLLWDKIYDNPTSIGAFDGRLIKNYPHDFSTEQIIGTDFGPDVQIVPSSEQKSEITLGRVVPNKNNPPGMRNVTK